MNITVAATANESEFLVAASLFDASGNQLHSDLDSMYIEMVEIEATSSTTGDIDLTNLSIGNDYVVEWIVLDYIEWASNFTVSNDVMMAVNASMIDSDSWSLQPTTSAVSYQINWTGPTTMNEHLFLAYISENGTTVNLSDNDNLTGLDFEDFIPQLPSLVLSSYSSSSTASTNNVQAEGLDLVVGDGYQYQYRVTDASNANIATSSMTAFTATAQNMSIPTFTYSTPSASGVYCVHIDLYSNVSVQLIGDSDCFQLTFDDDNDGVANEADLCPNTATGAIVDQNGCALAQKDTDGDGYNDAVDIFPNDATQWSDMDSDGYEDNAGGNNPDAFPTDGTQWSDADGDGYGDNANGNNPTPSQPIRPSGRMPTVTATATTPAETIPMPGPPTVRNGRTAMVTATVTTQRVPTAMPSQPMPPNGRMPTAMAMGTIRTVPHRMRSPTTVRSGLTMTVTATVTTPTATTVMPSPTTRRNGVMLTAMATVTIKLETTPMPSLRIRHSGPTRTVMATVITPLA